MHTIVGIQMYTGMYKYMNNYSYCTQSVSFIHGLDNQLSVNLK